ncbi:outer membrane scaffolding protein for murein synthesis (MipA/OmpV family) [Hoeflea halophila]|uniref:Outer membrane scaffolding protein for murein synthesis (MipA/OmpV family) n=1 Tax=Hoeflea halophila TaxID=714899 RepID=A0A286IED7_9HYPH|nr:MipA/OmpV family protein [Hoeflea halophila]SOE18478.1 outer membrane scaffolding protein for murein synthesis (MipA/OmpV family) [Hoeflea halophila]
MIKTLRFTAVSLAAATLAAFVPQASAQDATGPGISLELGVAGKVSARYFGSSKLVLSPVPLIRLKRLELPNGFTIGGGSGEGFSLSPSIDVIAKRSAANSPELAGLNTIGTAVELGVAAKYQMGNFRVMGAVRQGFGGHKGVRAELGADVIVRPDEQWTFYGGPRLNFGNSKFTNTYFGVTAAEASALYPATTTSGGLYSAGLEAGVRFQVDNNWAIEAEAGWSRLTGDAASSPIAVQGSRNQYSASLGVVRRFDIGF